MATKKVSEMDETTFDPTDSTGYVYYVNGNQSYKLKVKDIVDSISSRGGTSISPNCLDYDHLEQFVVYDDATVTRTLTKDSVVLLLGTQLSLSAIKINEDSNKPYLPTIVGQIDGGTTHLYGYSLPKDTVVSITGTGISVEIVPYAQSSIESTIETQLESIQSTIEELQSSVAENKYNYVPDWSTARTSIENQRNTTYSLTPTKPTLFIFSDDALGRISSIKVNSNNIQTAHIANFLSSSGLWVPPGQTIEVTGNVDQAYAMTIVYAKQ